MQFFKNEYGTKIEFKLFRKIKIHIYPKKQSYRTIGIRNHCEDGKRVVFLDYDNILLNEMLIPELKYLQEKYNLGNFYILQSSNKKNSYHAICPSKLKPREWLELLDEANIDEHYKKVPITMDYRSWVLRILPKGDTPAPKPLMVLEHPTTRINSRPHSLLLHMHYNYPIDYKTCDSYTKLPIINYATKANTNNAKE